MTNATAGQQFVVQVKYDTSTVKGEATPSPTTVEYSYVTRLTSGAISSETGDDSLFLKKK